MLLLTGASGQLGTELRRLLPKALCPSSSELDITDAAAVQAYLAQHPVETIINAAAYTAVDQAEQDEERAYAINALGPRHLAQSGLPLIHVSTDYVFDGTACRPYKEDAPVSPLGAYGRTKLAGEQFVMQEATTALVIRTSWLYSPQGKNFVKTMQALGAQREQLTVVADQVGTPTSAADFAAAIVAIIPQMQAGQKGIYHYSNEGVCSWYDFACAVMELAALSCHVAPISSEEYPTPTQRPAYSVLSKAKIKADFGLNIPHWRDSLRSCLTGAPIIPPQGAGTNL